MSAFMVSYGVFSLVTIDTVYIVDVTSDALALRCLVGRRRQTKMGKPLLLSTMLKAAVDTLNLKWLHIQLVSGQKSAT